MKNVLLLIAFLTYCNIYSQCDGDTIPPTFDLPYYLTEGIVYPHIDSVPSYSVIQSYVYSSMEDDCWTASEPPWQGPTLVSTNTWDETDTSITHRFYAYDGSGNSTPYSYFTLYFMLDECNPDTEAPTFELPMYLTNGIIYDCLDSVPLLIGPPYPDVMDLVFETLEDNCLSPDMPPWYGPTLSAGILDQTDSSIIYTFTAYDDAPNYNSQQMTFYFLEECAVDTINTGLGKYRGLIEDVTVYPNPSNGEFIVTSKYAYEIVDYMGIIQDKDNLESGVYLIRIRGQYLKNKLVIQK